MTDWKTRRLEELVVPDRPITYGVVKPGDEQPDDGIKLIRGGDVLNGRIAPNLRTIAHGISAPYRRTLLRGGELVVSLVGNPGAVAIVPPELAGANLARQVGLVVLNESVDPRFIMYSLMAPSGRAALFAHTKGSVQQVINLADLKRVPLLLPPLATQRRIGSILGGYDDLIEVNRKRIALLEEMARRLFEEWFVSFRFPGHEGHTMIETPDGLLPEGWQRLRLDTIAKVNASSIKSANAPAYIAYVDIASVTRGDIQNIEWQAFTDAPGRARRQVKDGSIIWSMVRPNRRSYALVLNPDEHLIVSTGFAVLDAVRTSASYLYHFVTTDDFVGYLVGNTTGAAYPAVTGATFERALALLPPPELDQRFNGLAEPMLRLVDAFRRQNACLATSRDLLLPRLISGELSVSVAERELEAVA